MFTTLTIEQLASATFTSFVNMVELQNRRIVFHLHNGIKVVCYVKEDGVTVPSSLINNGE